MTAGTEQRGPVRFVFAAAPEEIELARPGLAYKPTPGSRGSLI